MMTRRMMKGAAVTVIPAQAGWFLLSTYSENGIDIAGFTKEPIIAWGIEYDANDINGESYYSSPITIDGGGFNGEEIHMRPDGSVTIPYDIMFDNEADALAEMQKRSTGK